MIMLFSQRVRLVREDATISGMKEGQSLGHACFRIYSRQLTPRIARGKADLYEDKVQFVQISLLPPHSSLIWWYIHRYLYDKVPYTLLLLRG
jgi:hypothetical protein